MTASAYCSSADVYQAFPPGSFPNPGRLVADVETATEIMTLDGHGFAEDAALVFRAESGGSLPAPLVAGTTYYAIPLGDSTFSVAASAGGAAIDLTTAGSSIVVTGSLPWDAVIEEASAIIDDVLIAQAVPLDPVPAIVKRVAAQLAGRLMQQFCGVASNAPVTDDIASAQSILQRWVKGYQVRGPVEPQPANLAVTASSGNTPRAWYPTGGTLP